MEQWLTVSSLRRAPGWRRGALDCRFEPHGAVVVVSRVADLERIAAALEVAAVALRPFTPGSISAQHKAGGDPLTEADLAVDAALREILPRGEEGWLSEETADDGVRLECERVWIVDPIDGTREFVEGIPEWCVSIGLIEAGQPVAGGVLNQATGEKIIGGVGRGVEYQGHRPALSGGSLSESLVLASRSEVRRGEWEGFTGFPFTIQPMGSVAYKLALVAAGRADATWTLVPKHEWDVAAGAAMISAAGGFVALADGHPLAFNQPRPWFPNVIAGRAGIGWDVAALIADHQQF